MYTLMFVVAALSTALLVNVTVSKVPVPVVVSVNAPFKSATLRVKAPPRPTIKSPEVPPTTVAAPAVTSVAVAAFAKFILVAVALM